MPCCTSCNAVSTPCGVRFVMAELLLENEWNPPFPDMPRAIACACASVELQLQLVLSQLFRLISV